ncbi:MAG: ATP-binding protein [Oscillospiraceae bacterium]|jgi:AAA+ ATPase superfamily predicted ATPase|nr:ATP-binding protein [Oscillospiraceae bacterium]
MFVGRERELASLDALNRHGGFQFAVIYGRRRVGKTTLIHAFCRGKKYIYFVAVESTAKENLALLSRQILTVLAPEAPPNPFGSFYEAIEYVFAHARRERIIFAVDEYPYLAESDRAVSSLLQAAIDRHQASSRLFLILCGSSMSFMENQVLGYKSPLYGRRTSQYKILPLDYRACADMLCGFRAEETIVLYGATGGVPEYVSRIDNSLSVRENLRALFFEPSGRLFEEPANLLKQELKMPQTYNGIITAIASDSSRLGEIAVKAGIETSQCSDMLDTLILLGLVRRDIPVTETHSRKTTYALEDQMFRFWYRFVLPNLSRISAGLGARVCDEVCGERLNTYTGHAFETCAKQYMWRRLAADSLPVSFQKIGRWWGTDRNRHRAVEIDFIACAGAQAIFGECKWRGEPLGADALEGLQAKAALLPQFTEKHYMLFSKSGFTKALTTLINTRQDVALVSLPDMLAPI